MAVKRVNFPNAPESSVDNHQRYMIGVGLDPLALTSPRVAASGRLPATNRGPRFPLVPVIQPRGTV